MNPNTSAVPLLLRTIHSAPLGLYALKPLLQHACRLGYTAVGVADRESLSAVVDLGALAESMEFHPLCGMELFADPDRSLPLVLLALDASGYRQLLTLYSALSEPSYREGGLEALLSRLDMTGSGLACLLECPPNGKGQPLDPGAWEALPSRLHRLFEQMPQAAFYLRLPVPGSLGCTREETGALLQFAARTGLTPIVMPVAAFLDAADGPLYALGRQYRLNCLHEEGLPESPAAMPAFSEELLRSFLTQPAAAVEAAYAEQPSPLGNARRLAQGARWDWRPQWLGAPSVRLERGFNPETYLWDRIQNAVERHRPEQVSTLRRRLYEEFSALRRQGRVGLFLALCELFRRLNQPGLVALPDRMTRGLLCAHLLGLTPFDPVEQGAAFDEDTVRNLRNPLVLHIPDGLQPKILEILSDLFGEASLGVVRQGQVPRAAVVRSMVEGQTLARHPQAIPYLKQCGRTASEQIRWVLAVSRPIAADLPCQAGAPPFSRWSRPALEPRSVLSTAGIVFDLAPDVNRTRLYRLGGRGAAPVESAWAALSPQRMSVIQEILPLLYPRFERSVVWLAFRAMQPQTLAQLVATLALLQLERRDRAGFLRLLRLRWQIEQNPSHSLGRILRLEQESEHLDEILKTGNGLLLFRNQLPLLFEKVLGLPAASVATVVQRVSSDGLRLLPAEQMVKETVRLLENPEVTYPATQFLSLLPRYLSSRQHCYEWAKNLLQFAAAAEENPLAFAREVLDESAHPEAAIPAVQVFLEKRGRRLLPPDVNRSGAGCQVEGDALRLGFSLIENIGPVTSRHLMECRAEGHFASLEDVVRRTRRRPVNRRVLREMILCGAFDRFRGEQAFHQARHNALEAVATLEESWIHPPVEDLQTYLFDLEVVSQPPADAPKPAAPSGPAELVEEESRILGVPLSMPAGRTLGRLLPFEPALGPPARHHWWLGREVLQVGVLRDVWPWLESKSGAFTLAYLYSGSECFLVVADPGLQERMAALAKTTQRSGASALVLALGRLGGRPSGHFKEILDRFARGLLPGGESPQPLQQTSHLYLYDFESLSSVTAGAHRWIRLEVHLDQIQSRLVSRLRSALQPFRVEPRTSPGCRLQLHIGSLESIPRAVLRLEEMALLPSQMLLRRLERMDGVRSVRFVEGEPRQPLLLFP